MGLSLSSQKGMHLLERSPFSPSKLHTLLSWLCLLRGQGLLRWLSKAGPRGPGIHTTHTSVADCGVTAVLPPSSGSAVSGILLDHATCFRLWGDYMLTSHLEVLSHVYSEFEFLHLSSICFRYLGRLGTEDNNSFLYL